MLAENIHKRRKVVLALSCVVVFVTTYMLILPAFTLEKTKAAEQGGIDVPGVTTIEDVASNDTGTGNDDSVIVENKDNESDGQKNDTASSSDSSSAGKTESNNSKTTESKTDTTTKDKEETITEKEAIDIALKSKTNTAGVFEEEVIVSSTPASGKKMLKSAKKAPVLRASNEPGVWNLADTNNTQFLHVSTDSSVTQNEQERDAAFKLTFTYSLEEDVVKAIDEYDQPFTLEYDLSSVVASSPIEIKDFSNGVISIGTRKLGTYKVVGNKVYLQFTDTSYFDGKTSFTGYFSLTAKTNETELGTRDEYTYEFPGTTDTIPIHYKKTVEDGTKSVYSTKNADGSYTLHYTANINVNSELDSLVFNDTLGGLQTLVPSSVKISGQSVNVTQTENGFTFNVGTALGTDKIAKGSYQVTYETKVTEDQLKNMTADKTTETNTASWKVNGKKDVPGGETEIEIEKPKEPIPVEKTISSTSNQPGDTVTYTITYGNDKTDLAGFRISDRMTDVAIPQGQVSLSYNGQTSNIDFSDQSRDTSYSKGMVTLFDYTFPGDMAGNGPVTVTYTVKLIDADTAKANGVYDSTSVINTAQEHRQNTTDTKQTTVTYEKEPTYDVHKTATTSSGGSEWAPGTDITYTLTIGDSETNMAGVNIRDVMTDLQTLNGDVMIKLGNGTQMKLNDYVAGAVTWSDDGKYSSGDVELFNFNMPSNAGNGPIVITYHTKVITQAQAEANNIYGDQQIKNTGYGGKQSAGTSGTGPFGDYPIDKQFTQDFAADDENETGMGSTLHYTLTFGKAGMDLKGKTILDEMTDLQKLVGNVTVKKADGSTFTMPIGSGQWADNGVVWSFFDDERYSTGMVRVFNYKLPDDIGEGPITVEYDTKVISEEEANNSGIKGTQHVKNKFTVDNHSAETDVPVDYPSDPKHNPTVSKDFDSFNIDENRLYWNITVEKDAESAYPIENVYVEEKFGNIFITEPNQGYNNNQGPDGKKLTGADFDTTHAVVTTDDGTVLTPGKDYIIDKDKVRFTFPVLNERVHIRLAFISPIKIIDGYKMTNTVVLNNNVTDDATGEYKNSKLTLFKNGSYDENKKIVTWEVQLNPTQKPFADSDPPSIIFKDVIPEGLTLVNFENESIDDPTINVQFGNSNYNVGKTPIEIHHPETTYKWLPASTLEISEQTSGGTSVRADIAPVIYDYQCNKSYPQGGGLSGNKIVVKYKTLLSDEEWDRITSSATGSEDFHNSVEITAGDNEHFNASDTVTVTSDNYINKTDTTKEEGGIVVSGEGDNASASKEITYTVEINPRGYKMNYGDPLTLTDYISTNMDLDTSSVHVVHATMGPDGKLIPSGQELTDLQVSYNDDSRLLAIRNIPDNEPLLLTYSCYARAQGEDSFKNTATLIGGGSHSASTNEKHNVQTNDAGVKVNGITVDLHKIDENNISKNLAGAKFQLYKCNLKIGPLVNPERYPQSYWDDLLDKVDRMSAGTASDEEIAEVMQNFKITGYEPVENGLKTSGTNGYISPWDSLSEHTLYAWKEIESPENYTGNGDYHYFVGYQHVDVNSNEIPQPLLPESEQKANQRAAWALDDACQFANNITVASLTNLTTWTATNVESQYTSISATKTWENDSDNLFETRPTGGIKLTLNKVKSNGELEPVTDESGKPLSTVINADPKTGEWPTYIWNKLPSTEADGVTPIKYTVTEDPVDGYSTSYSDNNQGQTAGEIVVTNRMIPKSTNIHVKKRFEVPEGSEMPSEIKVNLMVIKTDKDGNASQPQETSYEAVLTESGEWKYTFENLPTKEVGEDGKAYWLSYTVVEDTAELERNGFNYIVSYSDNNEGVYETTEESPLKITNKKEEASFEFSKIWTDTTGERVTWPGDKTITVTFNAATDNNPAVFEDQTLEFSPTNVPSEWKMTTDEEGKITSFSIGGLQARDDNGNKLNYYVKEQQVEGFGTPEYATSEGEIIPLANKAIDGQQVINKPEDAVELPHTGGIGTTIFYILGSILVIGGGIYFTSRRRAMK